MTIVISQAQLPTLLSENEVKFLIKIIQNDIQEDNKN